MFNNFINVWRTGDIQDAGYSNVGLDEFRDAPFFPEAFALLLPIDPSYIYISISSSSPDPQRVRGQIHKFRIREEYLAKQRRILEEFILSDFSSGSQGEKDIWDLTIQNALTRSLPIAFIVFGHYLDDGSRSAVLLYPKQLMPDRVLKKFRKAVQLHS